MTDSPPDSALTSFLEVAADHPFPIQNLPYGVFSPPETTVPRVGVAIGDQVLDLATLNNEGIFDVPELQNARPFAQPTLNDFMALGPAAWSAVRDRVQTLLRADTSELRDDTSLRTRVLHPRADVSLRLPVDIGDYTDFYSSKQHATNVGTMFRGAENALKDNWVHLPVGYHGRASSVILSGRDVQRPCGQTRPDADAPPVYGPTQLLDFELETGFFVGEGNELGRPLSIDEADDQIFGMVLVNDWSARDIQGWEYEPLGPFLGKSFATTISPWVVPMAALEPFRVAGPAQDPEPLDYLQADGDAAYDVTLEVDLETPSMAAPHTVCRSNTKHLYWSMRQQLAHHTVNGCNARPGDLLASGTISGPTEDSYGSMLELSWRGEEPVSLPGDETRSFLEDGDRVIMRAYAQEEDYRVGFGTAEGQVLPASCA
ncbi:MAG: fumarylacetoacetase [Salinibacter sp.]|uniref:fumarylacetoacetase n=1 Tax=Salinibacter sp. TaxID=2065818 RepID=UPI002FC33C29